MKQDEAEKKKQEAKKRLAKAAAHAAGQKCQVMVAYDDCDQIEKVSESGFSKTNDRLEPVIVTMCAANDSWKAEHDKFMDEFTKISIPMQSWQLDQPLKTAFIMIFLQRVPSQLMTFL